MKQTLGQILYDARVERGMTVKDLSITADIAPNAIYSWEHGTKSPVLSNIQKVCKALNISITINENGEVERTK